jgi:hypothetical protein
MSSFIISTHPQISFHPSNGATAQTRPWPPLQISLDQIKENEVGRACGTHGRGEKSVQGSGGEVQRKETT